MISQDAQIVELLNSKSQSVFSIEDQINIAAIENQPVTSRAAESGSVGVGNIGRSRSRSRIRSKATDSDSGLVELDVLVLRRNTAGF